MTYAVAVRLQRGLVFAADTRTNAGRLLSKAFQPMGQSPQSCGCQHGRVQRLIVNGRHHARGPRLLFPMQGSFSFIKTSRKNAAYRERPRPSSPRAAANSTARRPGHYSRWNDSKRCDTRQSPSCCVEVRAHRWPRLYHPSPRWVRCSFDSGRNGDELAPTLYAKKRTLALQQPLHQCGFQVDHKLVIGRRLHITKLLTLRMRST